MLIELFITLEILAFILLGVAWFNENSILWIFNMIFQAILIFQSYAIEKTVYVFNTSLGIYEPSVVYATYSYLAGLHIGLLLFSLLYFFSDLLQFDIMDKLK